MITTRCWPSIYPRFARYGILNSWAVETNVIEWIAHIIKICLRWKARMPKIKLLVDPMSKKPHSCLEDGHPSSSCFFICQKIQREREYRFVCFIFASMDALLSWHIYPQRSLYHHNGCLDFSIWKLGQSIHSIETSTRFWDILGRSQASSHYICLTEKSILGKEIPTILSYFHSCLN